MSSEHSHLIAHGLPPPYHRRKLSVRQYNQQNQYPDCRSLDPDKLVPKARKQLAVVINREREEKAQKEKQQRLEKAAECDGYYQGKVLYWSFDQCSALFGCLKLRFSGVVLGSGDGKVTLRMIEGKERYGEVTERECYLFKKGL